jgi:hypothetical protein
MTEWAAALRAPGAARVRGDLDGPGELARLLRLVEIGRLAAGLAHEGEPAARCSGECARGPRGACA